MDSLNFSDSKLRKPLSRPLMLKDYLLDDLSSCSSNGFRSYPRRQCCTTVRFLLEIDLKTRGSNQTERLLRSKSKAASTTMSALQRASEAVINAVKLLPFSSVKSPSSQKQNKPKKAILPRSLSRKLWRRSFWKKSDKEIQRWKSFRDFLEEKQQPLDFYTSITTVATTDSNSPTNNSNGNSWSDSDFTSNYLQSWSCNSENSCENDVVESKRQSPGKVVSKRVGVEVGNDSMEATNTKKQWPNEEEKEQFSPVSVLDFPFDDEDEVSSSFQDTLARMEGTKQKLMRKIRRFESLAQLEPVDLEKRMALSEFSDESHESPLQRCSVSIQGSVMFDVKEEEENDTEQKSQELLKLMKETLIIPSYHLDFKADTTLFLDFFRERIIEAGSNEFNYDQLLHVAKDWMNGHASELLLGWEVQRNRQAYIIDMEKAGRWRKLDEDNEEVVMQLEVEVFAALMNELLLDFFS
ncbi:hypothetical protein F0562_012717 [Nyssa sinensis]|uniref:DUF4378 domain-containing protein n=1 Tax=Nyssa sinensis TaxID=561372 RepID=A0A5J4ZVA8_9ASTE|nr:hypothetical protein F0562_012717 [Nyssa sinensis]